MKPWSSRPSPSSAWSRAWSGTGAVTPETEDPLAYAQDLQRERCVLFVACTRARDHLHVSGTGEPSPFLPPQRGRAGPAPAL